MSKILKLCHNEILKIFKKVSVLVLLILMVVGIFGIGAMLKFSFSGANMSYYDMSSSGNYYEDVKSDMENTAKVTREKITELGVKEGVAFEQLLQELSDNIQSYEYYSYMIKTNSSPMLINTFMSNVINNMSMLKAKISVAEEFPQSLFALNAKLETSKAELAEYEKILESKDYKKYVELQKKTISDSDMSDDEKEIELASWDLFLAADPDGTNSGFELSNTISTISSYKKALLTNIEYSDGVSMPLSATRRQEIQNSVDVAEYKVKNGYINLGDAMPLSVASQAMNQVGIFFVIIMVLILAGGSVAQEITSGSIKSLIISPTKRWKIYLAKLLTLTLVGLVMMIAAYLVTLLASFILFGEMAVSPYVYAVSGTIHIISPFVYGLLTTLVSFINVFVYLCLAFMLSIVTRNTAASVAISIGTYFVGSVVTTFITGFGIKGEWIKFIPFLNLDLANSIFPNTDISALTNSMGITFSSSPTLSFSICYLIVMVFCMLYIAFDSFTRRDI